MADLLARMADYVAGGEEVYPLRDALQDMYLCLEMEKAMAAEYVPVTTETQPWCPAN